MPRDRATVRSAPSADAPLRVAVTDAVRAGERVVGLVAHRVADDAGHR